MTLCAVKCPVPLRAGVASASHPAWWILTALGAVVFLLGFMATTGRATESARHTAAELNPEALVA